MQKEERLQGLDTASKDLDRASAELRTASQTVEEIRQAERGGWGVNAHHSPMTGIVFYHFRYIRESL